MMFEGVDWRVGLWLAWGGGTVIVYAKVVSDAFGQYIEHRDSRARREMIEAGALFIVALSSLALLSLLIFSRDRSDLRALASSVVAGAFLAAGVYMVTDRKSRE